MPDNDLLEEYDFSDAEVGRYAERYARGTNLVLLEPDIAKVFPDSAAVNRALRTLAEIIRERAQAFDLSRTTRRIHRGESARECSPGVPDAAPGA